MNYWIYNFILIVIIIAFAYNNSLNDSNMLIESFTPKVREMYRPLVRNARLGAEGLYNKHSSNMSNLFRRFGLM
jgi:hypothetical protein